MKRSILLIALLLATVTTATVAFAAKPVTPQYGLYYGRTVGAPENGSVEVHETEVKVVKVGKLRGAQVRISPFSPTSSASCTVPGGFALLEKTPIPIKNGKFTLDRTARGPVAGGSGTATTRRVITGTFKSATKVVVTVAMKTSYRIQFPGNPEIKGTCTGKYTGTATHQ